MRKGNLFLVSGLISIVFFSCKEEKAASQDQPLESFRGEVAATPVRTAKAERKTFDYLINASGKIEAVDQIMVVAERSGYLDELSVKEGDYVEKGKILARMDQTESQIKLEKARIGLKNAKVAYQSEAFNFPTILNDSIDSRKREIEDFLMVKSGQYAA